MTNKLVPVRNLAYMYLDYTALHGVSWWRANLQPEIDKSFFSVHQPSLFVGYWACWLGKKTFITFREYDKVPKANRGANSDVLGIMSQKTNKIGVLLYLDVEEYRRNLVTLGVQNANVFTHIFHYNSVLHLHTDHTRSTYILHNVHFTI